MKKLLFVLVICISFVAMSCEKCAGVDKAACYTEVQKEFPNGKIFVPPTTNYRYVVTDSANVVWYVECMSVSSPKVTFKTRVN